MIVVCTSDLFPSEVERLESAGHTLIAPADGQQLPRSTWAGKLVTADALLCLLTDAVDGELLRASPNLRIVANIAVGYENIDVAAATALGVVVTNTPGVLTEATADLAFALILAASRRVAEADAGLRCGSFPRWTLRQPLMGRDVHGKTLGIVGMGRIGTAVARRAARGFAMRVVYHSRTRNHAAERELGVQQVSFEHLLETSDIISVHVPLTGATRHLFHHEAFARMKPTAIFVNTARGAVVEERALIHALRDGVIAGAGLDVYENEPSVPPALLEIQERVVLTPHLGSATLETRQAMARLAVDNVLAVLRGRPPLTPVT